MPNSGRIMKTTTTQITTTAAHHEIAQCLCPLLNLLGKSLLSPSDNASMNDPGDCSPRNLLKGECQCRITATRTPCPRSQIRTATPASLRALVAQPMSTPRHGRIRSTTAPMITAVPAHRTTWFKIRGALLQSSSAGVILAVRRWVPQSRCPVPETNLNPDS